MSPQESIKTYLPVAEYLSLVLGSACEVALLDTSSYSVVAVYNAFSGIKVGSSVGQTVCTAIGCAIEANEDYIINQEADNGNIFSALLIKDGSSVVGALCLLKNLAAVNQLEFLVKDIIEQHALRLPSPLPQTTPPEENRVKALLHSMVSTEVNAIGIHPTRLTLNEKAQIVQTLSENGTMMIEGAVAEIARQLFISEPTVYRYLNRDLDSIN